MRTTTLLSYILAPILIALPSSTALHLPPRSPSPGYVGPVDDVPSLPTGSVSLHTNVVLYPLSDYTNSANNLNRNGACADVKPSDDNLMSDTRGDMKVSISSRIQKNWKDYCGKRIRITGLNGKQAEATVVDVCDGCEERELGLMRKVWEAVGRGSGSSARVEGVKWKAL